MPSDIQVFVRWKDQTIFAGETVECIITFKNVADKSPNAEPNSNNGFQPPQHPPRRLSRSGVNGNAESLLPLRSPSSLFFSQGRRSFPTSPRRGPFDRSHRVSTSLSSPLSTSRSFPPPGPSIPRNWQPPGHAHKRSVSILSIDSEGGGEKGFAPAQFSRPRPVRSHGRSASMQVLPRRNEGREDTTTRAGPAPTRGPPPDTLMHPQTGTMRADGDRLVRRGLPGSGATSPDAAVRHPRIYTGMPQAPPLVDFKFPAAAAPENETTTPTDGQAVQASSATDSNAAATRKDAQSHLAPGHLPQLTRITSVPSVTGSNRSSAEFYSVSDHSSETLASEYTNYSATGVKPNASRHMRHLSSIPPPKKPADAQTLLMGFAQISGAFTVDGSLINQSAFEEVKRKGVVGNLGSSASVPTEAAGPDSRGKPRKAGGLLGALGWNTIEDSISGLLAKNDLDGLRDMRGVPSSRSIPLLSTPQSLLFVDLRLGPGEEQSFSFSFTIPRGLPASHKGKAIKIVYNLVIGTQRASGPNEPQRMNRINVPFRVFSGVNDQGEILGHDLMSPYIILRDEARIQRVEPSLQPSTVTSKQKSISTSTWASAPDFLSYVDEILAQGSQREKLDQLPPRPLRDRASSYEVAQKPLSCKDAIDFAILRSNQMVKSALSPNRFEIAKNGRRIAVVVLNRPSHRLGETIVATVDFTGSMLPCYALRATLETSEKVAAPLAVRSEASIYRATRRIHASFFENTLYSTKVVFSPAIPISSTPTILTSGVTLHWELRFEFVTASSGGSGSSSSSFVHDSGAGVCLAGARLLETVSEDNNRGSVLSAVENLQCESFEIAIPLSVYGETVREPLPEENEGYSI